MESLYERYIAFLQGNPTRVYNHDKLFQLGLTAGYIEPQVTETISKLSAHKYVIREDFYYPPTYQWVEDIVLRNEARLNKEKNT